MDTLKILLEELEKGPTIIEIESEMSYFIRLQQFSKQEIFDDFEIFQKILGELMNSHTDNFYAVNEFNISSFSHFSDWLKQLSKQASDRDSLTLRSYADDFALDPEDY